jgi:hypothetical protein
MSKAVEIYRGIEIFRFEDYNHGYTPLNPANSYVFIARHRKEDDAPIIGFAPTIEQAREEIDWELGDVIVDLRPVNLLDAVRAVREG